MKKMTMGIIASLSAAAVITTGALVGVAATTTEPEPTPTSNVVSVEENTLRQEAPDVQRQTVLPPPAPVIQEQAPAPTPEPEPEREQISGSDCPDPYVMQNGRCNVAICRIEPDGTETPCEG